MPVNMVRLSDDPINLSENCLVPGVVLKKHSCHIFMSEGLAVLFVVGITERERERERELGAGNEWEM